jgi:hypothetical protein
MKRYHKPDKDMLRSGTCRRCKANFWWTGAMVFVPSTKEEPSLGGPPPCSCGSPLDPIDFHSELLVPGKKGRELVAAY